MLHYAISAVTWLVMLVLLLCIRPFAADRMYWMFAIAISLINGCLCTLRLLVAKDTKTHSHNI